MGLQGRLEATYRITEAALESRDTAELFQRVHRIVRDLMPAENLHFALWDRASDTLSFPYWADAAEPAPAPRALSDGLTEYVLRNGQPLLVDQRVRAELEAAGEVRSLGSRALNWLGVPLRGEAGVFGVLVIQSYEGGHRYTGGERDLLAFVSAQVAMAIERTRVQAEQRVLMAALDCAADPVFGIGATGTFVFVNQAACTCLGYSRAEFLTMNLWEIDPGVDPAQWPARWEQARTSGSTRNETRHLRKDGVLIPVEITGSFLATEGREIIFAHARDITSRKAAEEALRYSEEKFSRTFHASPDAINISRLEDGTYLDVSEGFEKISGWTRAEAIGRTALELNIWADPRDRQKAVDLIRKHGEYTGLEFVFRRKDGSLLTGLMSGKVMEVGGVPCLLSFTRDITDRKNAESAQLTAEQRLRTVLANSQAIIYQLDPEGRFLLAEGLGLAHLGLAPGEAVGKTATELLGGSPEALDQVLRAVTGLASREVASVGGRLFDNFLTPVFNEHGHLESVIGIATDITERQRMEEALRQSQKLESLGILAGGIAHDFNNLLTVVLGNLNLAQMHLPEHNLAQPYLAKMEATILRATELTKQMLAYSGRGHFHVQPLDLNAAVHELTHLLEVSISKKVQLRFDLEPGLPAIQADAAQIQQVIMNLVTNASDAIGDQEGVIHLATSTAMFGERELRSTYSGESLAPGRYVLLEITDTGIGMTPEVMANIFDPFFSTKAAGRGLGLSAMLGILRGHGAGLWIASELGHGSSFRLCFPATDAWPAPAVPVSGAATFHPLRGRILLVDDEELILQAIGSALEALGLEVITAQDGLEALEQFKTARPRPDLVLMDLTMPRLDGREAFQAMHDLNPSIPVVLSSGFTEQDSLQTLAGEGPAGFMQKPYQIKELRALLQRLLGS
jgi:PAS domain S-box-containing protein